LEWDFIFPKKLCNNMVEDFGWKVVKVKVQHSTSAYRLKNNHFQSILIKLEVEKFFGIIP